MSIFCRLTGRHYWCTPHRSADHRLIQVCYECGAERPVRELHNEFAPEKFDHLLNSSRNGLKAYPRVVEEPVKPFDAPARPERIAVGQGRARRFMVVK
ncbi:MAG TPA: hypothetical protein VNN73_13650 [Blastocatellia bacterium]|nr:hypothetical protein [Blastocatellia bacterium]